MMKLLLLHEDDMQQLRLKAICLCVRPRVCVCMCIVILGISVSSGFVYLLKALDSIIT